MYPPFMWRVSASRVEKVSLQLSTKYYRVSSLPADMMSCMKLNRGALSKGIRQQNEGQKAKEKNDWKAKQ